MRKCMHVRERVKHKYEIALDRILSGEARQQTTKSWLKSQKMYIWHNLQKLYKSWDLSVFDSKANNAVIQSVLRCVRKNVVISIIYASVAQV